MDPKWCVEDIREVAFWMRQEATQWKSNNLTHSVRQSKSAKRNALVRSGKNPGTKVTISNCYP